jgi:LPS sulfotransferase NodH
LTGPCNFIVCTTQRSGKTWLVRTLECLGTGAAQEYVTMLHRGNAMLVEAWNRVGLAGFVEALLGQQAGRPAGLSVPWNEMAWLARHSGLSEAELLDRLVELMGRDTRLLFLVRRDIVAQAVSHYLLRETGYAHSFNSEESRQSRSSVEYDAKQISRYLSLSQTAYQAWRTLLKDRAHCIVHYEQLTVDTVNEVRRLLTYIGFGRDLSDARIASCAGRTEKVGDRLNEEMIARFISEPECQATIAEARKLVS